MKSEQYKSMEISTRDSDESMWHIKIDIYV